MKKSTIWIIIGFVLSLLVVPLIVYGILVATNSASSSTELTNNPPQRTDSQVADAIAKSNVYLRTDDGKPDFDLLKVDRLAGNWYMAWIDDQDTKVLVNDPAVNPDSMKLVLGPASTFDESAIYSIGIPADIFKEFVNAEYK